jgi:isoamylase
MPRQEFDSTSTSRTNPQTSQPLTNYWGYDPVVFRAPKASYSSAGGFGQQKLEFKEMVQACHNSGIEVILDVVFNHTAKGNELGPTLCFRGMNNEIFYTLADAKRYCQDYTGTGNTINANHPVVRDHILSALRYWTVEMTVDGFRFDLASVLGRDGTGKLLASAPLLERIAEDPILRDVKIIAEAWDTAGAYEVGSFSERRWAEWNGRYRDDVRRFWRGDDGMLGLFASRIRGSADIYARSGKGPEASINFVTYHDGFTLNDLVSFRSKHNDANGENNHDGTDADFSENYGVEGETTVGEIESLRKRQIKDFLLTLFISRGVPMLLGGDEFRRTQGMIAFRRAHPILSVEHFYTDAEIHCLVPQGGLPNLSDPKEKRFACLIHEDVGFMARTEQMTATQFNDMADSQSGLLGVSETSSDMHELLDREARDVRATEAVALFCCQVKKWIGAFAAALRRLDTLVFAGGIGESALSIRAWICAGLEFLGVEIDEQRDTKNEAVTSAASSRAAVGVIQTDEQLMIAETVCRVLGLSEKRGLEP